MKQPVTESFQAEYHEDKGSWAMCSGGMSLCSAERYMGMPVIRRLRMGAECSCSPFGDRPDQFPEARVRTAKPSRRMAQDTVEPHSRIAIQAPTTIYNGKVKTATYLGSTVSSDCPGASKIMVRGDQVIQEYGIGNSPGGQLINQANGLCADVMNGSSEVGAQLIQYACNNGSNQVFVFASDGTLHTQTHCLDAGSSPPDGAPLVLAECNTGSPTQHWGLHPYGIESSGGLTIGIENYSTSSGARLIVKEIDYSNYPYETKWTFNTAPSPNQ